MGDSELKRTSNIIEMVPPTSTGEARPVLSSAAPPSQSPSSPAAPSAPPPTIDPVSALSGVVHPHSHYVDRSLHDAEAMVAYAAEAGIGIDEPVRRAVLEARAAHRDGALTEQTVSGLLVALTKLAVKLRPVTAESLRACEKEESRTLRRYWLWVGLLAACIIPFSIASFVSSAISQAVRSDIALANGLTVKLTATLDPPAGTTSSATVAGGSAATSRARPDVPVVDALNDLQTFAATIRAIDNHARQLQRFFPFSSEHDPYAQARRDIVELRRIFQLPIGGTDDLAQMTRDRIKVYQDVRYFAQCLLDNVTFWYGALATCLLPVLYAWLGTCAYLLQLFEDQMKTRTFTPSPADSARFLIAGIGGAVVGLFNNFSLAQGTTIPPLALAFLVGYAVDVFFSFLDGLVQAFKKSKTGAGSMVSKPGHAHR